MLLNTNKKHKKKLNTVNGRFFFNREHFLRKNLSFKGFNLVKSKHLEALRNVRGALSQKKKKKSPAYRSQECSCKRMYKMKLEGEGNEAQG